MIQLQFIGNLTADAQMKKTQKGENILVFSVAVNEGKGQNKRTLFIDCIKFVDETSTVVNYMKKGQKIYAQGVPTTDYYINRRNEVMTELKCRVNSFELIGSGEKKENEAGKDDEPLPF